MLKDFLVEISLKEDTRVVLACERCCRKKKAEPVCKVGGASLYIDKKVEVFLVLTGSMNLLSVGQLQLVIPRPPCVTDALS